MTTVPKELLIQALDALGSVQKKMTPQVNGADESCFIIGMRNQVTEGEMCHISEVLASLQAAIDQPEQEPDYLMDTNGLCHAPGGDKPLSAGHADDTYIKLYTHPAPAKPLTDEQIGAAITAWFDGDHQQTFLKRMRNAVDAAHKIGEQQ